MTISSTVRKAGPFDGTGSQTEFPFEFKVFSAGDLYVVQYNEVISVETVLELDSDYTVTLNADQDNDPGGTIELTSALLFGYTLIITSSLANLQPTDLTNRGGFYPSVINDALDRACIQIQQLQDETDRTLKTAVSVPDGVDNTLPMPAANMVIGWDNTGVALKNWSVNDLVTSVAYGSAKADIFTGDGETVDFYLELDPASINNLDVSVGGICQVPVDDYTWTSGTKVTFTTAPPDGETVLIRYMQALPQGTVDAANVPYTPAGGVQRTAASKFAEAVSVKDFGAVGNGVANDTAAIQTAIAASAMVIFPNTSPGGTTDYSVKFADTTTQYQSLFYLQSNAHIIFEPGARLIVSGTIPDYSAVFGNKQGEYVLNVVLENIHLEAATPLLVNGVNLFSADETVDAVCNWKIVRPYMYNISGSGVYILQRNNDPAGMATRQVNGVEILDGYFYNCQGSCVTGDGKNITIQNNVMVGNTSDVGSTVDAISCHSGINVKIIGNDISYFGGNTINLRNNGNSYCGGSDIIVSGNTIHNCTQQAIDLNLEYNPSRPEVTWGLQRVIVTGNIIKDCAVGVNVDSGSNGSAPFQDFVISNNQIDCTSGIVIQRAGSFITGVNVSGNKINASGTAAGTYGLYLKYGAYANVTGNIVNSTVATANHLTFACAYTVSSTISDNAFNSSASPAYTAHTIDSNSSDISFNNNYVAGGWSFQNTASIFFGNKLKTAGVRIARNIAANTFISEDAFSQVTVKVPISGGAPSVTGTWVVGDRLLQQSPTIGSPKAWTCTTAGIAGSTAVFTSEGNL